MLHRIAMVTFAASLLLAASCKKEGVGAPPGATMSTEKSGNDTPTVTPAAPPGNTCFGSCMLQMAPRAVSAAENTQDCRARCERECVAPCKSKTAMRAVSPDQINSDCRKSCGL